MDENMQLCENSIDFLYDQQDFLVVGCLGAQGVGKSTIMSLLTSHYSYVPHLFATLRFIEIDVTLIVFYHQV